MRVLVIDDESNIRVTLGLCLEAEGHEVQTCSTPAEALAAVSRRACDLVFLDVRLGTANGLDLIPRILAESPWAKVVVITAYASAETAMAAMDRGAADYLPKPFTPTQVQLVTRKAAEQRQLELRLGSMQRDADPSDSFDDFTTTSSEMRQAIDLARRLAPGDVTLLIRGEAGVGKSRLARAIHAWSGRVPEAFAEVSCRTESAESLEAELFGISARDLPNAPPGMRGCIALCGGGTLVLDEVGAAPPAVQPKLVRLLHDREYERVNDFVARKADLRIVATTSRDLEQEAASGALRTDLLLAVNIVQIDLPPLRRRPEDIRFLADRFRRAAERKMRKTVGGFAPEATEALVRYAWPGNLRELQDVVERAVLQCESATIGLEHLPPAMVIPDDPAARELLPLQTVEEMHIRRVLARAQTIEAAAAVLGIDPATLWRRRKRYGM
ncbi:MAG: two component, sigma54 specific, transcriptional regulator, Fis family [Phycisphaerales bacterium]|nr:two component, sigma54 specific, transcriptional regulator, Fis family [Phycisphaerales bacterium]MDB5358273.1 two component, sigma54 specific, transcriptional regulator, Fis family [Phycisphaerales bacterium]